jgi:hypothetical protein
MRTLLDNATPGDVRSEPFPHLVIEHALLEDLADRLLAEFPPLSVVTQGQAYSSNQRFSYNAADAAFQGHLSTLWQEWVATHITKEFYLQFVRLFTHAIHQQWPQLAERLTGEHVRTGMRHRDSMDDVDVVLDCQVCLNTPVVGTASAVKIAHLDNPHELFAGLLYLRPADDDSTGADLEIFRYRRGMQPRFHGPRLIDWRFVEKVSTIPYRHNTLILFLNTPHALHGVTARSVTHRPRYLVNVLGEVKEELFDMRPSKERLIDRVIRHLPFRQYIPNIP